MYYPALIPFLQQFPASQLFIIRTEDILLNPSGSFQSLARFLDIDPTFFAERNFYQDEHLTEEELLSRPPPPVINVEEEEETSDNSASDHQLTAVNHQREKSLFFHQSRPRHNVNHKIMINDVHIDNRAATHHHLSSPAPFSSTSLHEEQPELSTRYRLQRVFRHLNDRLIEIFDNSKTNFNGWIYDVDRG
jgi:hypothetical protein